MPPVRTHVHEHHVPFTTEVGAGHEVAAELFAFPCIYVKQYCVFNRIGATKSIQNKWNNTGASASGTHRGNLGGLGGSSKLGNLSSHYKSRCIRPGVGVADTRQRLPSCVVIAASCLCDPDRPSDLTARCVAAAIYICSVKRETCFFISSPFQTHHPPVGPGTFLCVWLLIVYKVTHLFGSCDIASDFSPAWHHWIGSLMIFSPENLLASHKKQLDVVH